MNLRSLFSSLGGATANCSPYERFGRVRYGPQGLFSADGKSVTLRGASLFWSQWEPEFFTAETVDWLAKDWRIDVIRVPIAAMDPGYLSSPEEEILKATTVIQAAVDRGLYVIVDWHGHEANTPEALSFFAAISHRYGNNPQIFYEPWNEPARGIAWPEILAHHIMVTKVIREYAPDAPVILGIPQFCTQLEVALADPAPLENCAYSFHFYAASHREGLRLRLQKALQLHKNVLVSEWGVGEANGDGALDLEEARRWLTFLNEASISHLNWSICDKQEACAALVPGAPPGGWRRQDLTRSGHFVRGYLRGASLSRRPVAGQAIPADGQ